MGITFSSSSPSSITSFLGNTDTRPIFDDLVPRRPIDAAKLAPADPALRATTPAVTGDIPGRASYLASPSIPRAPQRTASTPSTTCEVVWCRDEAIENCAIEKDAWRLRAHGLCSYHHILSHPAHLGCQDLCMLSSRPQQRQRGRGSRPFPLYIIDRPVRIVGR